MDQMVIAENEPYPGAYPINDGAVAIPTEAGLMIIIQCNKLSSKERKAFKKGLVQYGFYISNADPDLPVIYLLWDFPAPLGAFEVNIDPKVIPHQVKGPFLHSEWNLVTIVLLDGNITKGIKVIGLDLKFTQNIREFLVQADTADYSHMRLLLAIAKTEQKYTIRQMVNLAQKYRTTVKQR